MFLMQNQNHICSVLKFSRYRLYAQGVSGATWATRLVAPFRLYALGVIGGIQNYLGLISL